MKAVISVFGKDQVGILAFISGKCASVNANVIEVSQNIVNEMFQMVMIIEIDQLNTDFKEFVELMSQEGKDRALVIKVMHADIFNAMHKV